MLQTSQRKYYDWLDTDQSAHCVILRRFSRCFIETGVGIIVIIVIFVIIIFLTAPFPFWLFPWIRIRLFVIYILVRLTLFFIFLILLFRMVSFFRYYLPLRPFSTTLEKLWVNSIVAGKISYLVILYVCMPRVIRFFIHVSHKNNVYFITWLNIDE